MPRPDMQRFAALLTESVGAYQLSIKRSDFHQLLTYVEELEEAHEKISDMHTEWSGVDAAKEMSEISEGVLDG